MNIYTLEPYTRSLHSIEQVQRRYDNITCVNNGISINSSKSTVGVVWIIKATPTITFLLNVNWHSIINACDVVVPPLEQVSCTVWSWEKYGLFWAYLETGNKSREILHILFPVISPWFSFPIYSGTSVNNHLRIKASCYITARNPGPKWTVCVQNNLSTKATSV